MLSSSPSSCSCASGSCTNLSNSVCCSLTISSPIVLGGATVMTYIVPRSGTYTVSGVTTSGVPPSRFVVFLNGSVAGSFNGSGGSISVNANTGDVIKVSVYWGMFYPGGTVLVCIIPPTPTPTPIPPTPTGEISLQFLIILIILISVVLLTVVLITYMK